MNVIKTTIDGVVIIEPRIFKDPRGYFLSHSRNASLTIKVGPVRFVQDNESMSSYGVMCIANYIYKYKVVSQKLCKMTLGQIVNKIQGELTNKKNEIVEDIYRLPE